MPSVEAHCRFPVKKLHAFSGTNALSGLTVTATAATVTVPVACTSGRLIDATVTVTTTSEAIGPGGAVYVTGAPLADVSAESAPQSDAPHFKAQEIPP